MTPITERLAEAYQKLDAINEIIFAAENAAMACDVVQPTIKMLSDSDIKRIFDLSLHAEYEASRTHPAEGGEEREPVRCTDPNCEEANRHNVGQVNTCVHFDFKTAYARQLARTPPPQPVAPEERGEAKAVAPGNGSFQIGWYNTKYKAFFKMDEQDSTGRTHEMLLDGEIIRVYANATPQPPPAPPALRYRDPTIEDARFVRDTYLTEYSKPFPTCSEAMLTALKAGGFVVNAIGARVEDKT